MTFFEPFRSVFLWWTAVWAGLAIGPINARSDSNIDPAQSYAYAANLGWLDWRAEGFGAAISEYACSGYVYSPNAGWINLGNGQPANGMRYQNNSSSDFGVNVDDFGQLRGFAYGANIGWIAFESLGAPRLDLFTGILTGSVYGANVGWIQLSGSEHLLRIDTLAPPLDNDFDGLPDAWELARAGSLEVFNEMSDSDGDGQNDFGEYVADTNPLDASDRLRIVSCSLFPNGGGLQVTWTSRPQHFYRLQIGENIGYPAGWSVDSVGPILSEGTQTSFVVPESALKAQSFFRIEVVRPLVP